MLADAHAGHFDVVVIWARDRFGRDTIGNMIAVRDLDRLGVQLVSVRERWLDTTGPTRILLIAIFSWVAQQEREQRSARTRAGLARVREKGSKTGKPIGRPLRLDEGTVRSRSPACGERAVVAGDRRRVEDSSADRTARAGIAASRKSAQGRSQLVEQAESESPWIVTRNSSGAVAANSDA